MGYRSEDGSRSRPGSRRQPGNHGDQEYSRQSPPQPTRPQQALPGQNQQWLGAPTSHGGDDWYSGDQATGGFTDPYGIPGDQVTRDPVRGYPPAPDQYPADGQRFDTGSHAPAPYDAGAPGFDDDAYERAFSGDGYPGPGHPSGGYPVQYDDEEPLDSRSPGPRSSRSSKSRRPKKKRRLLSKTTLLSVTAGIVALAVGGAAYVLLQPSTTNNPAAGTGAGNPSVALPSASASAAACSSKLGTYCHIESRTLDPTPLTLAEVFRAAFENTSTKQSFVEAGQRLDTNCDNALVGTNLQSAVSSGKCTQVLRASYVSGDKTMMGTVGVVNLNTTNAAEKAAAAVDGSDFLSPLTTSKGVTKSLGQGVGVVQVQYKGHYLILMFAEYTNLKTPDSHENHLLETFEQDLVAGTINIALSERMVTGAPTSASS
jgi:hypothetical protein